MGYHVKPLFKIEIMRGTLGFSVSQFWPFIRSGFLFSQQKTAVFRFWCLLRFSDFPSISTGLDISTRPGECQKCWASTNHRSLARFGEYDFQLQNILFKISVTLCFSLKNNLHCPQLIAYNGCHFEIFHKPGALLQINFWFANIQK